MIETDDLAEQFETHRPHLKAVAYRMLGSLSEAEDAVQDAWLRLSRADTDNVENMGGWLTTTVARLCLDMLRTRKWRGEESFGVHLPDPIVTRADSANPEQEALLDDSVGLALIVVLQTLSPPERVAFVLHDVFGVSFDEIAAIVGRTPAAARQLASRARRRVRGGAPAPDADLDRQREVVEAFLKASRAGNFDALLAVLDPDVVLRSDFGPRAPVASKVVRGAQEVANQASLGAKAGGSLHPVLVNGASGVLVRLPSGKPFALLSFTVAGGRIVAIEVLGDPARLQQLDLDDLGA